MNAVAIASRKGKAVQSVFRGSYDSSSFGPIGYISPVSADRLKGFIGYVGNGEGQNGRIAPIENDVHARYMGDVVREGIRRLKSTGNTRLSLRTIVSSDALETLATEIGRAGAAIEATMPVGNNYSIAYIGYNAPSRQLSQERRDAHEAAIKNVRQTYEDNPEAIRSLAYDILSHSNQYTIKIVDGQSRRFSEQESAGIASLLSTFGYDAYGAISLVSNGHNIIGLVYQNVANQQTIVGISITERRTIELSNGQVVQIAEITDGTVSEAANRRSLYSRLLSNVFGHISQNCPEISVIYAESNVSSDALLKAAAIQGRSFGGILPNHARIMNRRTGELELKSLAVTSLTREQVMASARRLDEAMAIQQAIRD